MMQRVYRRCFWGGKRSEIFAFTYFTQTKYSIYVCIRIYTIRYIYTYIVRIIYILYMYIHIRRHRRMFPATHPLVNIIYFVKRIVGNNLMYVIFIRVKISITCTHVLCHFIDLALYNIYVLRYYIYIYIIPMFQTLQLYSMCMYIMNNDKRLPRFLPKKFLSSTIPCGIKQYWVVKFISTESHINKIILYCASKFIRKLRKI